MATIEKLFVQIFDRKRSIIDNLKQQQQLYHQHLASNLLIHGISPPPFLLTPDFSDEFSVLKKVDLISGLLLPHPGPVVSYPSGLSFFHDKPVGKVAESGLPNELHATCASSNGDDEVDEIAQHSVDGPEDSEIVPPCHVDGPEKDSGIVPKCHVDGPEKDSGTVPPCHVDGFENMPSYIPMSPEDQTDTVISSTYAKAEESLARIQRSKSRQKALEHRNSAKASAKSCLGREGDNQSPGKETRMNGQQLDDLRESVELAQPLIFSSGSCTKEAAVVRDCARDTRRSDTGCNSHSQTAGHKIREVQMGDSEMMGKSSDCRGLAESRSSCSLSNVGDCLGNDKMTGCRNREAQQRDTDDLQNGRETKVSSEYMHYTEGQAFRNTKAYHGRVTRSRSGTEKASCGHQNHSKSQEVFVGRMTRSRSGNAQQPSIDVPQNEKVIISHHCQKLSTSGHVPNRSSKACSGKITTSRSMDNRVEADDHRIWAMNGLSVQPKQLDFDDAEESCLSDIQTKCQGISVEKKTSPNVQENFVSLSCSLSTERTSKSLSCEKLETCSRENAQLSLIGNTILGKNLVFTDCPAGSQLTDEHELGSALDFEKDATLSRMIEYSHQKHTIEPEGGQTLSEEAARFSLMDSYIDAMINLHRETSGASVSLLNIQHELSSDSVHNTSSHDRPIECVQSSSDKAYARSLNSTPDFHSASTSNEPRSEYVLNMKVDCQSSTGGLQTSCFSSYVGSMRSKLQKLQAGRSVLLDYNYENAMDCSYPCYKRRKIEYQLNSNSAGPSVRLDPVSAVNKSVQRRSLDNNQGARISLSDGPQLTPNMQHDEGHVGLGGSAMKLFTSDNTQPSISCVSKVKTAELSDSFSDERKAPVESITALHCNTREYDDLDPVKDVADGYFEEKIDFTEIALDQRDSLQGVGKLKFSVGSPLIERMDVYLSDGGDVPEYESFVVSEERLCVQNDGDGIIQDANSYLSTTTNDSSLLGKMCLSASLSTPASPFPTGYKFHQMPSVYHSVPNGLLEDIDLGSNELVDGSVLRVKSYSDYSFPSIRPGWDTVKPYISPLGKGFDGTASKSGGSGKQVSGNMELVCFPIKEDPESSDEEVNGNDVGGTITNEVDSATRNCSIREPLRDITSNNESTLDPSQAVQRSNAESVRSEVCADAIPNKDCKKNEFRQSNRLRKPRKENQSLSIGANSLRKHSESLSTRNSKPKLSGKSSLQSRGQSLSEKEPKRNNIVSNVKSFLPIVQQKPAAAALPAKREVKVKALEAAEAAKRLAEKRENERKQKKEAMKLERSRLEQENMKQMELKKKLKEKEKKKRDAENAEKKRQREEEEKKEKERKRRRVEGARVQQQRAEEKLHSWREESRCEIEDGKAYEQKDSNERKKNQDDRAKEQDVSKKPSNELLRNGKINAAQLIINDKASTGSPDAVQVGSIDIAEISTPNVEKNFQFSDQTIREQSYDISPYQCSDDEEDEEDDVPCKKFIPMWASKSNVMAAWSYLKQLDPESIFPPRSLCSFEEVGLPRRLTS